MKNQKVYLISFVFIFFTLPVFSQQENTEEEMNRLYEIAASKRKEYLSQKTNGVMLNVGYHFINLFSTVGVEVNQPTTALESDGREFVTDSTSIKSLTPHKFGIGVLYLPIHFLGIRSNVNFAFGQMYKGTEVIDEQGLEAVLQNKLKSKQYSIDLSVLYFFNRMCYFGVGVNYANTIATGTSTKTIHNMTPTYSNANIKPASKWNFPIFLGFRYFITRHLDLGLEVGYQNGMYYGIHAGFPLSKKTVAARIYFVKKRKEYRETYKQAVEIDRILRPEKFINDNSGSDSGGGGGDGGGGGGGS